MSEGSQMHWRGGRAPVRPRNRSRAARGTTRATTTGTLTQCSAVAKTTSTCAVARVPATATGEAKVADLCLQDKHKIGSLIRKVVSLQEEYELKARGFQQDREAFAREIQRLNQQNSQLVAHKDDVKNRFHSSLTLLRDYRIRLRSLYQQQQERAKEEHQESKTAESLQEEVERLRKHIADHRAIGMKTCAADANANDSSSSAATVEASRRLTAEGGKAIAASVADESENDAANLSRSPQRPSSQPRPHHVHMFRSRPVAKAESEDESAISAVSKRLQRILAIQDTRFSASVPRGSRASDSPRHPRSSPPSPEASSPDLSPSKPSSSWQTPLQPHKHDGMASSPNASASTQHSMRRSPDRALSFDSGYVSSASSAGSSWSPSLVCTPTHPVRPVRSAQATTAKQRSYRDEAHSTSPQCVRDVSSKGCLRENLNSDDEGVIAELNWAPAAADIGVCGSAGGGHTDLQQLLELLDEDETSRPTYDSAGDDVPLLEALALRQPPSLATPTSTGDRHGRRRYTVMER